MAASMRDIKESIRSKNKTMQITKAMKMVSASKLRRSQEQATAARPYAEKMKDVIMSIASGSSNINHPMMVSRPVKKTGYLVISSDRGLAGGYNSNLLRLMTNTVKERHASNDDYVVFSMGRKALDFFKKRNTPLISSIVGLSDSPQFSDVKAIANQAVNFYAEEKFDELYIVYNEFVNPVVQRPVVKRLLPLASDELEGASSKTPYEFEPSEEEVLADLLPRYAETLIYSALLDAKASEFAARMTAMTSATDNATAIIERLTLEFNRARQAAITQEIAEIVGGVAALS
ncbi:F-type H+-transporting ATPase subunit gamma [Croceifilum oryzae]|uniref:ATP synthase gamma chain n=1 Tax=Croceifilum oryzae TaxID=1553429 RepID=A0AAJ1TPB0_9BACL|nr:ATP synthase F1 subunit gamma [Croceifilum oryzae]MDQ0418395.1 F-type H+-transporting ATPase subunit gamma [Croceifilum oryzae]